MTEVRQSPDLLRLVSAVLLGGMIGVILFLIVAIAIGFFNNSMNMNIPLHLLALENITSVILLVIFMAACIGWFVHLVMVTPPTDAEKPGPDVPDEIDDD
jgi:amino acid transporter